MPACEPWCPIVRTELKKIVAQAPWIRDEQLEAHSVKVREAASSRTADGEKLLTESVDEKWRDHRRRPAAGDLFGSQHHPVPYSHKDSPSWLDVMDAVDVKSAKESREILSHGQTVLERKTKSATHSTQSVGTFTSKGVDALVSATAVGPGAVDAQVSATAVGPGAVDSLVSATAVGPGAVDSLVSATAVGPGAVDSLVSATAVGPGTVDSLASATAVGSRADDLLVSSVSRAGDSLVSSVSRAGDSLVSSVSRAGDSLVSSVPRAGDSLVSSVTRADDSLVSSVSRAAASTKGTVTGVAAGLASDKVVETDSAIDPSGRHDGMDREAIAEGREGPAAFPDECEPTCPRRISRENRIRKLEERQSTVDAYLLNKGSNYFDDVCTCSLSCVVRALKDDSFVRSILASAVLFTLGLKLCMELDSWYLPIRLS